MHKVNTEGKSYHHYLKDGGEMGRLTRDFDWSKTILGTPEKWSQSLLTTLSIVLNSKFPMFLWWGPELIQFYNDAYRPSLGKDSKHPQALGQKGEDCWPEIWTVIKPLIDQIMAGGEAAWGVDQLIPIYRNGQLEDVYWTFSYSRVNDESGNPTGVLVICKETTDLVAKLKSDLELKTSEERYRILFSSSPLPKWIYEFDTLAILDVNDAAIEQYGYSREEFLNMTILDMRPAEEIPKVLAGQKDLKSSLGMIQPGLFIHQKKDKTKLNVEISGSRFVFENINCMMMVGSDVTENLYHAQLDKLENDILKKNVRKDQNLNEVINSYLLGIEALHPGMLCSLQQIKGKQLFSLASPSLPKGFLDAIEGGEMGINAGSCGTAAFIKGKVVVSDIAHDERWQDYKDIAAEYGFKACWSTPILDRQGDVMATFANYFYEVRKPTEKEERTIKRAGNILQIILESYNREQALKESDQKYNYATKATSDAIWDWDLLAETISWGESYKTIFGYKAGELKEAKRSLATHIHHEDLERVLNGINEALNSDKTDWEDEYRYIKHDKTYADVIDKGIIIRDADGRPVRMIGAMHDITKQKHEEQRLKSLNEKLLEISWLQSHIIRAPLTRIMGLIQLIEDMNVDEEEKEKALKYIMLSAKELDEVIKNITKKSDVS